MSWIEVYHRYFIPRVCGGCREVLPYPQSNGAFCPSCRLIYDRAKTESCPTCFCAMSECLCVPDSLRAYEPIGLCKLFRYNPRRTYLPHNRVLYVIKKQPIRRYMRYFSTDLAPIILRSLKKAGVKDPASEAILVSIPRSPRSKIKWGFDQSEETGRLLSELTGIPYAEGILRRRWGGREQKKLSKEEREENLKGLLYLKEEAPFSGKTVVLFDDIVTTGASLRAALPLLQKAGARQFLLASFAVTKEEKRTRV